MNTYIKHSEDDSLTHYGVKGMKWKKGRKTPTLEELERMRRQSGEYLSRTADSAKEKVKKAANRINKAQSKASKRIAKAGKSTLSSAKKAASKGRQRIDSLRKGVSRIGVPGSGLHLGYNKKMTNALRKEAERQNKKRQKEYIKSNTKKTASKALYTVGSSRHGTEKQHGYVSPNGYRGNVTVVKGARGSNRKKKKGKSGWL